MIEGGTVLEQAIAWHLRLAEADEAGWASFVEWLEASEAHAVAYDQVACLDGALVNAPALQNAELVAARDEANDNVPEASGRRRWLVGATSVAAAALVALIVFPRPTQDQKVAIFDTPIGVSRTVQLGDGSSVDLGGGSRLRVDSSADRMAELERGEALFHVRHNSAAPFRVTVGNVAVQDLGTVFSVARDSDAVRVAVAEGSVAVRRDRHSLTLRPGDTAIASAAQDGLVAGRLAPAAVGGWRDRSLTFQGEPLSSVIERLNRLYALHISLAPNLSDRPFTGMVQLTGDAARDVPHLAALIGTTWRREGDGWLLSSADSARR